jgi:pyruvyltransferase
VAVGSIAHAIHGGEAVIWGSGVSIRGGLLAKNVPRTRYDVRAIRGPISAGHLRDFGIPVPEVYGDPVWLLPSIFQEKVEKRWELGVIPHIQDIDGFGPLARPPADSVRYRIDPAESASVTIINTWHDPTWEGICQTLRAILSCKRIVSQSFHGVVIAEAFGIPVLNYRQMPGVDNGALIVSLEEECSTDPRVWEFYRGGPRRDFPMYAQRREERTDWEAVIREVDRLWQPFRYDASALVESFPLPLAYDPLASRLPDPARLSGLKF